MNDSAPIFRDYGPVTRAAAVALAVLFMAPFVLRCVAMFQDGVTLSFLFDLAVSAYLAIVMGYAGLTGMRPPPWLLPVVEKPEFKPLQIRPWAKKMAGAGFVLIIVGLLIWTGEIRSGASESPSAMENLGVALFMLGMMVCLPPLFSTMVAMAESAVPEMRSSKAMERPHEGGADERTGKDGTDKVQLG